jgi:hypothetical protein
MAASYPGSVWAGQVTPALQSDAPTHRSIHDRVAEEIVATQTELGANPSGASATVAARLDGYEAAWTAATPTLTNVTLGTGGTNFQRYKVNGKTCHVSGKVVLGTSGDVTGTLLIGLPFTSKSASVDYVGSAKIVDSGTTNIAATADIPAGNSAVQFTAAGTVGATVPMDWTVSDSITYAITYEIA